MPKTIITITVEGLTVPAESISVVTDVQTDEQVTPPIVPTVAPEATAETTTAPVVEPEVAPAIDTVPSSDVEMTPPTVA